MQARLTLPIKDALLAHTQRRSERREDKKRHRYVHVPEHHDNGTLALGQKCEPLPNHQGGEDDHGQVKRLRQEHPRRPPQLLELRQLSLHNFLHGYCGVRCAGVHVEWLTRGGEGVDRMDGREGE